MGEVNDGMLSPFQSLPEGCKSHIIFYTSIQDACSASLISKEFNSASKSDTVWGKFLPPDLKEIISNLVPWLSSKTKKELYRLLCHFSNPIDKGILINKGNRVISQLLIFFIQKKNLFLKIVVFPFSCFHLFFSGQFGFTIWKESYLLSHRFSLPFFPSNGNIGKSMLTKSRSWSYRL